MSASLELLRKTVASLPPLPQSKERRLAEYLRNTIAEAHAGGYHFILFMEYEGNAIKRMGDEMSQISASLLPEVIEFGRKIARLKAPFVGRQSDTVEYRFADKTIALTVDLTLGSNGHMISFRIGPVKSGERLQYAADPNSFMWDDL